MNSVIDFFASDPIIRRRVQKKISYHIPFRPTFIFFVFYIFKLGFLDGKSGYDFCRMRKLYETMIDIKYRNKNR